jgi:hypothetical protein
VPPSTDWHLGAVSAPVAEEGVDLALQNALLDQLSLRQSLGNASSPTLTADVLNADWVPTGRSGEQLLYEARLTIRLHAGSVSRNFSATQTVLDPGTAGASLPLRAAVFAELSKVVAQTGINWVLSLPPG